MGITRDLSKILSSSTNLATDAEVAAFNYLTQSSASSTYLTQLDHKPSFRNLIINGDMQIAQRGTSTASITSTGYYTADRWESSPSGTWTQSVENDAPTGSGFAKSLKVLITTANASPSAGSIGRIEQKLEGQNLQQICKGTSSAKQLSLTFWVKSNVTGTYIAELIDDDNTRQVSASYTINTSATWEKKTITFPADSTGAFDNDNALSLKIRFWLTAGNTYTSGTLQTTWATQVSANRAVGQTNLASAINNYWQVTGVQLEVGPVATPFEFLPAQTELALCQRYYYNISAARFGTPVSLETQIGIFTQQSGTVAYTSIFHPQIMRAQPVLTLSGNIQWTQTGVQNTISSFQNQYSTAISTLIEFITSGLAVGSTGRLTIANGASGVLSISAEL